MKSSSKQPLIKVGKITEAHSLQGEIKIHLFAGEAAWLADADSLWLSVEKNEFFESGNLYQIEKAKVRESIAIVKLKGIANRTAAENLKNFEVWISRDLLKSKTGQAIYLNEILNFTVVDESGRFLGTVVGFDTNSSQDLLVVETAVDDAEEAGRRAPSQALVPLIRPFLKRIDYDAKKIIMDLPQGLLEVNREG